MKETTITAADVRVCDSCGAAIEGEQIVYFAGNVYCPDCAERYTAVCSCCGRRILAVDNAGTDSHPLCRDCFDDYYVICDSCGVMLPRDEAYYSGDEPYYRDCYNCRYRGGIEDYYYKPEPIFYGSDDRFFGV